MVPRAGIRPAECTLGEGKADLERARVSRSEHPATAPCGLFIEATGESKPCKAWIALANSCIAATIPASSASKPSARNTTSGAKACKTVHVGNCRSSKLGKANSCNEKLYEV